MIFLIQGTSKHVNPAKYQFRNFDYKAHSIKVIRINENIYFFNYKISELMYCKIVTILKNNALKNYEKGKVHDFLYVSHYCN